MPAGAALVSEPAKCTPAIDGDKAIVANFSPSCAVNTTSQVSVTRGGLQLNRVTQRYVQQITLRNTGASSLAGPITLVVDGLSSNATVFNKTGTTACEAPTGSPYINVSPGGNVFGPGQTLTLTLDFTNPSNQGITYTTRVLAGTGAR